MVLLFFKIVFIFLVFGVNFLEGFILFKMFYRI